MNNQGDVLYTILQLSVIISCLLLLLWVFYPAILIHMSNSKPRQKNTFSDFNGIIEEDNQIQKSSKCDLSLVVPAYNEELRILPMLDETTHFMNLWCSQNSLSYEIIIVDDGSSDRTVEIVKQYISTKNKNVKLLKLGTNRGKGGAVKCGIHRSVGKYILMVDADGATDIKDLEKVFNKLKVTEISGPSLFDNSIVQFGMAVGSRAHMAGDSVATRSLLRTILMKGFHFLVMILISRNVEDTQCGFKLFTRQTARTLFHLLHLERWSFDVELIFLAESFGMPIAEVPVNWHEVDGSKLIQSKWDIATTSLTMARDMLCVRLCYTVGLWSSKKESIKFEKKSQ